MYIASIFKNNIMKKILITTLVLLIANFEMNAQQYEYSIVTSVESLVTSGAGRSRMISVNEDKNFEEYTTTRTEDKDKDEKNKSDRGDIRVREYDETKLLNFYNITGIRFQNIAANDALMTSKINTMADEGWELVFVNTGVESDAGKGDGNAIFITRYTFRREK